MRTAAMIIAGIAPPQAPGCNSIGRRLADLTSHQCHFPLRGEGAETRFCAVEVSPADWRPGASGGQYCTFHRCIVVGRGTPAERQAPRVLERLG
ncbi:MULTISPECIES: hypothetical protein [unclassified Mesorhizobium]|uniref:hypothetical protein n=1 Tax=unclassified Mesorhizobium TaxID=325217 RepID=UPI000969AD43|nr:MULTISPECIES: hypothetical protein [unclassified Mesorhizobium]MBN9255241.1 hypothetical protein [Mesorhizobium sp.]OJX74176.1 MAG: hypothetical protein BGO93_16580 [Mesorhizobium sp. 65-26]